jgi:glycosyltransferase involved in cell wall biosynthesis
VTERARLRIVAALDREPWADRGRSSSRELLLALDRLCVLAGAVSVKPRTLDLVERAVSVSRSPARWRQRYWSMSSPAGPLVRAAMTRIGARRVAAVDPAPDAVLQISGRYDAARPPVDAAVLATYQDANLALWLRRPDLALDPGARGLRRTLDAERRAFDRMDVIFTKSEWARRSFIDDYGQEPRKVITAGAGAYVDLPDVAPREPGRDVRFLFVGRNWVRKGGPDLLAAFARVRREVPQAELVVAGPPELPVSAHGVTFRGPVDQTTLRRLFAEATVFVLPTSYEGLGIPFIEAMAHGLPCIGTRVCAVPELVQDGVTGLLVEPGDVDALAERMLALARDPVRAVVMGAAGRRRAAEHTQDRVAAAIVAGIKRAAGRSGTGPPADPRSDRG